MHVWQEDICSKGACMAGGVHVRACVHGAWCGACRAGGVHKGETAIEAGGTHPTGTHSCLLIALTLYYAIPFIILLITPIKSFLHFATYLPENTNVCIRVFHLEP